MVDTSKLKTMRAATLCFLAEASRVVLAEMLRGPFKGYVNGYGGEVEETDITGATVREIKEECGVHVDPAYIEPVALIDFYNYKDSAWRKVRVYISIARRWKGVPHAGDGMAEPEWFDVNALPVERMLPSDRLWIPKILRGDLLQGEVWHDKEFKGFAKEPSLVSTTPQELAALWRL